MGFFGILSDLRLLLKDTLRDGDRIALYDLALERSEMMGRLIRQVPEYQGRHGDALIQRVLTAARPQLPEFLKRTGTPKKTLVNNKP